MAARTNQNNNPFTDEGVDENELNDTFNGLTPMNSPIPWDKTPSWSIRSSGTADTNTTDKLVDSGASFSTDGVTEGMIVYNSDDGTFGVVDAVDSETSLSLRADARAGSSTTDVFPLGSEAYTIYNTMELPDCYLEMNGQTISDADSIHNGKTLPDLNGTPRFLRSDVVSSGTGGSDTKNLSHLHTHTPPSGAWTGHSDNGGYLTGTHNTSTAGSTTQDIVPAYFGVVMIYKIK